MALMAQNDFRRLGLVIMFAFVPFILLILMTLRGDGRMIGTILIVVAGHQQTESGDHSELVHDFGELVPSYFVAHTAEVDAVALQRPSTIATVTIGINIERLHQSR